MKKKIIIIVTIVAVLLLSFGIYKVIDKVRNGTVKLDKDLQYNKNGIILEYSSRPNGGSIEDSENYKYIVLYSDKNILWGKKTTGEIGSKKLSNKEFNSIISLAFTKKFRELKGDISDLSVKDGSYSYITIYYKDGSPFRTGGLNPNNKLYTKLVKRLNNLTK